VVCHLSKEAQMNDHLFQTDPNDPNPAAVDGVNGNVWMGKFSTWTAATGLLKFAGRK